MQDSSNNLIIKSLAPSNERLPLFIVGDVHGCAKELYELIESAKKHVPKFQLILVGDLFTKGPDPVGVYELIQQYSALCIKGNHDWALWSTIQFAHKRSFRTLAEHTKQTLHLIRYHKRAIFEFLCNLPHAFVTTIISALNRNNWESEYPLIIVHAGLDATKGLLGTSERMLLTARYVKWDSKNTDDRKLVVVPAGYRSEILKQQFSNEQQNMNSEKEKFRWHELHNGPALVVFGHDAKQGLFRKTLPSGRPICVGIDTGCTYGNSLTGYFPEFDLAIQVRSHRKYFDVKKNVILLKPQNSRSIVV
ncbi:metallophosphoesterase [Spirobacillus cienkowskii]|uniref:metallophosphoesterase n=1 Tax=Spirobacillus cienkowskii TaxID=495820 RepID=UPI0030D3264C